MKKLRKYISENRLAAFVLTLSVCLGTFARVWNLYDARFRFPDSYLSLVGFYRDILGYFPFFNLVYKIPKLLWGNAHHVALYTTAFWGILSIFLVFWIGKILFNDRVGAYAAFIFSLFAPHVEYSRTGLACVFQTFLTLIAFLLFLIAIDNTEKRYFYLALSGVFLGLSFLTYTPSYGAIFTFFILLITTLRFQEVPLKRSLAEIAVLGASSFAVLVVCEILGRISIGSYFYCLLEYIQKPKNAMPYSFTVGKVLEPFRRPFTKMLELGGIFQVLLAVSGVVYCTRDWFLKRDNKLFLLVGFICISYLIMSIMTVLLFHYLHPRRILYIAPFLCISIAYLIYKMELITNKYFIILFFFVYSVFSLPKSYDIVKKNTFKILPIIKWLESNRISKEELISSFDLDKDSYAAYIFDKGSSENIVQVPGSRVPGGNFKIDWKKIKVLCRENGRQYILTSGMKSNYTSIGYNDPVLKKFNALKTWAHPFRSDLRIAVYDLKDIIVN